MGREAESASNKSSARLWSFKVALLLTIFSFSGFIGEGEYLLNEPFRTELVETSVHHTPASLSFWAEGHQELSPERPSAEVNTYGYCNLLNFNSLVEVRYKSSLRQRLPQQAASVKWLIRKRTAPSEEDDNHLV
ncbi:hypothetical protein [Neolewinella agarilytica]|uniref:Uncharacterized protein n=1 Tax=Neolewinella agarilytica TaxID=478744 RepID=A0A1H9LFD7_9BACT|nr:hypothetical protein [Neolewinella agarilytica]SER10090.1 hypothetical protein SAMN05444359_12414 [Neolewinella agarilytica]